MIKSKTHEFNNFIAERSIFVIPIFFYILFSIWIIYGGTRISDILALWPILALLIALVLFFSKSIWIPLVILTIPFREISLGHIGVGLIRIGDLIILVISFFWIVQKIVTRSKIIITRNNLDKTLLVFLIINVVSLLWATNFEWGVLRVFKFFRDALLFLLIREFLIENFEKRYYRLIILLLVSGFIVSLPFVYSIVRHGGITVIQSLRSAGDLSSASLALEVVKSQQSGGLLLKGIAAWLPFCAFLGIGLLPRIKTRSAYLAILTLILGMFGLTVLSCMRSSWLGLIGGILVLGINVFPALSRKRRKKIFLVLSFIAVLLFFLGIFEIIAKRIAPSALNVDAAVKTRLLFYQEAITAFFQHPLLGAGVASIPMLQEWGTRYRVIHSLYLQILGELGIVGFAVFGGLVCLWLSYLVRSIRQFLRSGDWKNEILAASVLGATIFYLVASITVHTFDEMEPWILLSIVSALFVEVRRINRINPC